MIKRFLISFVTVVLNHLCANQSLPEKNISKKINAHLTIHDVLSACEEAQKGLIVYPHSKSIHEAYIKALAQTNDDKLLWKTWTQYAALVKDPYQNRDLLETMAWGIIQTGSSSSSPVVRSMALLGAFFGQDAKGVDVICKMMRDSNSLIRSISVKLASHMHDARLCDEMIRLIQYDKNWNVRIEVIKGIGSMKLDKGYSFLMTIIESQESTAEEKLAAVQSLVELLDKIESSEIRLLVNSERSGLRLLACKLIEYFNLTQEVGILEELLTDRHPDVRIAALHALGILRISLKDQPNVSALCFQLSKDSNPFVSLMGAWILTLNQLDQGQVIFHRLIQNENIEVRRQTAAALASTGKYGLKLMIEEFKQSKDQYVRMNLALGLITQRTSIQTACEALYKGLMLNEKWMWNEQGYFKILTKSHLKHDDSLPYHPESINQITRLEILNILFMMKFPGTLDALKTFLKQKSHGITGLASALLLTEGDEEAIKMVQELLIASEKKIQIQAALVLAIWGKGEEAISILEQAYSEADRSTKERILEGLGRIGAPSTIPFLVEKLQEPYQTLRIIAAASLLDCLNH